MSVAVSILLARKLRFLVVPLWGMIACLTLWADDREGVVWQVTLRHGDSGGWELLEMERAPKAKLGSITAGGRTTVTDWQWLDRKGEVLFESVAYLPIRISVPVGEAGLSELDWIEPEGGIVTARVLGPVSEEEMGAVRIMPREPVRGLDEGLGNGVLSMPEETISLFAEGDTGPVGHYALRDTGADSERLVLVIVGDGYLKEDIDSGLYREHAERTLAAFEGMSPWNVLLQGTNVYVVDVVSAERGASRENGVDGTIKDTYFEAAFHHAGIERLLYPQGNGVQRAREAADGAVGVGAWDQVIMMVNSTKYGGSGGSLAIHSMNAKGPKISVHEVGHSYANLTDEYDYGNSEIWSGSRPNEANVDTDLDNLKWSVWLEGDAPIPTPNLSEWNGYVGAFEGAKYKGLGVYRPERACMMRDLNDSFCKVCVERHILRYFELLPYRLNASPVDFTIQKFEGEKTFSVDVPPLDGLEVRWFLENERIEGVGESSYTVHSDNLNQEGENLSVELFFDNTVVRSELPGANVSWDLGLRTETVLGTPLWWLEDYGLGTARGVDEIDHDIDGFSTAEEYWLGTDPTDYSSRWHLGRESSQSLRSAGRITWPSVGPLGIKYRLERSVDFIHWELVPLTSNMGFGYILYRSYYDIPEFEGACFYRLSISR